MKIFVSHADEQKKVVEQIAIALRNADHIAIFDKDDLPADGGYNTRIRLAIERSDVFIYYVSPESVAEDCYARTELLFAQKHFKKGCQSPVAYVSERTNPEIVDGLVVEFIWRAA